MAVLETLEGDNMEPEILNSGIPAKFRAAAANKGSATRRPVRRLPARGAAGARPWGGSSGRFVMVGDEFDPESLEGWLTGLKKGAGKAVRAVGNVGSAIVRPVASAGLNVLRSTAKPAGTLIGTAVGSAFGTTQTGSALSSLFGMGGGEAARTASAAAAAAGALSSAAAKSAAAAAKQRAAAATAAGRVSASSSGLPKWLLPAGLVLVGGVLFLRGGSKNAKSRG